MKLDTIHGQRVKAYRDTRRQYTFEEYLLVFIDHEEATAGTYYAVATGDTGNCCHCAAMPGRHLGRRIALANCPPAVRELADREALAFNDD